jgi:uncharacterized protein (DUF924 family)
MIRTPNDVLEFWFGQLDTNGCADEEHSKSWWSKDPAFDTRIRQQFGETHNAVSQGRCEDWLDTPRKRLAYIIVLDQFSRNMFRDSAKMFASDPKALAAAIEGIDRGADKQLMHDERGFMYMPLMHSENLEMQNHCVDLFTRWQQETTGDLQKRVAYGLEFAQQHRNIIKQFGRFPHRNVLLSRKSTPEEIEFLKQPGSSF